ncbi:hypothetical protein N9L13_01985 [Flavobacteriales bacterium]|nr:hypothetical protein [Flavobacteriales bacterium]
MKKVLAALFAVALGLSLSAQVPNYVPTDGLVAWYPFNGNANDESGNGFNGDAHNTIATIDRNGFEDAALKFNGIEGDSGSTVVIDHLMLNIGQEEYTIHLWFRSANLSQISRALFNTIPHTGIAMTFNNNNSPSYVSYLLGPADAMWNYYYVHGPFNDYQTTDWYALTLTKQGADYKKYINGVLESAFSAPLSENYDHDVAFRISGISADWQIFDGDIDDVGFWNRALTEDEVLALFNTEPPISGCTDSTSCNFNAEATSDDGSCLSIAELSLEDQIQIDSSGQLILVTPETLQNWTWDNGTSGSSIPIGSGGTFSIQGAIGDIPDIGSELNEGLVFAVDASNQIVYIASPEEIGTGSEWGCYGTPTGATGQGMGDGIINTQLMLENCSDENAAVVASDYGENWYLPSFEELDAIRTQLHDNGFGDYSMDNPLSYNWYWSSSECSENPHWAAGSMHFSDGFYGACNNKNSNPGGVIAAKMVQGEFCHFSDTITIEVDCSEIMDLSANSTSCGPGTYWDELESLCLPIETCQEDLDGDGVIGINDLMELLSSFGTMCDGPETGEFTCGNPIIYHGYDYATVQIGEQCWFAENLRTTTYRNGDVIPAGLADGEWASTNSGATAVYGEGSSSCANLSPDIDACDEAQSLEEYGRLYNWYALDNTNGLCPSGWHVPTDGEWTDLENYISAQGFDGTEGTALKSTYGWYFWVPNGAGTDDFGFSALPSGMRSNAEAYFTEAGNNGYWWSSSPNGGRAWYRELEGNWSDINRNDDFPQNGFSIRCIKDTE